MTNELQVFNFKQNQVRTQLSDEGEPMFCLRDVCNVLGIKDRRQLKQRLNTGGMCLIPTPTNGGKQKVYFVNEPNLYKAILKSDKPEALEFENWICEKVLPSIRKTGGYMTGTKNAQVDMKAIKGIVNKTLEEKLARFIPAQPDVLKCKYPANSVHKALTEALEEMKVKNDERKKQYMLTDAEAGIVEAIRSDRSFFGMDLFFQMEKRLVK